MVSRSGRRGVLGLAAFGVIVTARLLSVGGAGDTTRSEEMETKHSGAVLSDGPFRAEIRSLTSSTIHARFLSTALEHSRLCGADASPPPSQPWRCVTWEHAIDLWKSPGANGSSFRRITVSALRTVDFDAFFWETPPFSGCNHPLASCAHERGWMHASEVSIQRALLAIPSPLVPVINQSLLLHLIFSSLQARLPATPLSSSWLWTLQD
eukprot:Tamp_11443.p1 GENE.Tamp_11443~~Tamp_11443.p1  ORF type:complete len:209 (+),score=12.46 Tamp_11443:933-1559(+)